MTSQPPPYPSTHPLIIKHFPKADYAKTHSAMSSRILDRIELAKNGISSPDELWIVEHNDVYTLGQAGKESHILKRTDTPIIKTDRGGQVTWHGQGQLVLYWLFDLKGLGWSVRELVSHAEQAIEDVINQYLNSLSADASVDTTAKLAPNTTNTENTDNRLSTFYAKARKEAPGVYIYSQCTPSSDTTPSSQPNEAIMLGKIASLGFKIKHGMSYHGIAVNLNCDLSAFSAINPCGYAGMTMLRLCDFVPLDYQQFTDDLLDNIHQRHQGNIQLRASGLPISHD